MTPAKKSDWINQLYYGDNLDILRNHVSDESVDLIYLDPPFNSNATYNVLFKSSGGGESPAQIEAFDDTWHWDDMVSGKVIEKIKNSDYQSTATMLDSMLSFLGKNDMTAYLCMMAIRLVELHRVLAPTGSLYLHCDQTASHYLKLLLDSIFGAKNFKNEIVWKRKTGRGATNRTARAFGTATDVIFFYVKSNQWVFEPQFNKDAPGYDDYVKKAFVHKDESGRVYAVDNLSSPSYRPNLIYSYKGYPPPKKGWAISLEKMKQWDEEGRLEFPKTKTGRILRRRFLDDLKGRPVSNLWDDINMISALAKERLGYPTQKPVALLERIIAASSNKGDVILDPFCGCGTTIHAAQKLGRKWIGIDVTPIAINLVEARLFDAFPKAKDFDVIGLPKDIDGARKLFKEDAQTKKEFEKWACGLIKAYPQNQGKKGADGGIDGLFWFGAKSEYKAIVSVKGGKNAGVSDVRELDAVVKEQKADIGVFLTLNPPTAPMMDWAKKAGVFKTESHGEAARIQIITIEEALKKRARAVDTVLPRGVAHYRAAYEEEAPAIKDILND